MKKILYIILMTISFLFTTHMAKANVLDEWGDDLAEGLGVSRDPYIGIGTTSSAVDHNFHSNIALGWRFYNGSNLYGGDDYSSLSPIITAFEIERNSVSLRGVNGNLFATHTINFNTYASILEHGIGLYTELGAGKWKKGKDITVGVGASFAEIVQVGYKHTIYTGPISTNTDNSVMVRLNIPLVAIALPFAIMAL